jgi:hypothetical protein
MAHLFRGRTKRQNTHFGIIISLTLVASVVFFAGEKIRARAVAITKAASKIEKAGVRGEGDPNSSLKPNTSVSPSILAAVQGGDPFAPCTPTAANPIACENSKLGNPASEWDITGAGDGNIQGFATDISVNRGETVHFKILTGSTDYRLDIYRLGYYNGLGARKISTVQPSAALPQGQPACLTDSATGLIDCGNWTESASWAVPANATSGIYIAKLAREDGVTGTSHIVFIVRDDSGNSDLLFQTSDTTWQAYNSFGGNSLYSGAPVGRAYKVSYNRPFSTREGNTSHDWLFDGEYPMVRWIEANGFNVSYFTGIDSDRRGAEILEHKVFVSAGHDEYWSGNQRTKVEAARDAGVHLAFFSGNLMFWKTRWENSIDGAGTPYRTMVCYKETHAGAKIDPLPNVWTGTWRDPRFSPPADGGRPENALTGTYFMVNGPAEDAVKVSDTLGKLRFWRNTTVAAQSPGDIATIGAGTVGYEWDADLDNATRPSGLIRLSENTVNTNSYLQDFGSVYGNGTATHSLTLYRSVSGAQVFSAGTIRWSWGLDNNHDQSEASAIPPTDDRMRQATVNLFADMGVQPATLQAGLTAASQSLDNLPPVALISTPLAGGHVPINVPVSITGTAIDNGGGIVAGVNVSLDGGQTWKRASGGESWSYSWTPTATGATTIKVISIDDSGNSQSPAAEISVTVDAATAQCPCSLFGLSATPAVTEDSDDSEIEVGVKFRSDVGGTVTALRFYKGASNTGVHTGTLWSNTGSPLASATFINETASGWQQVNLSTPVPIVANTIYVASYHAPVGHYAVNAGFFATSGLISGPLRAPAAGTVGGNGVFKYGPSSFPTDSFNGGNYWVDLVFEPTPQGPDTTPPTVVSFAPASAATEVAIDANVTATFSEDMDAATITGSSVELRDAGNNPTLATVSYNAGTRTVTLDPIGTLALGGVYTARVRGGGADPRVKDLAGNALAADTSWSFTVTTTPGQCPCSLFGLSATPAVTDDSDGSAIELGVKFQADVSGWVTALRFYKGATNTGVHTGTLWSNTGTPLASATFINESASGWQQVNLSTPIPVAANTIYVASYHTSVGHYSSNPGFFATSGLTNSHLNAPSAAAAGGNGVFKYGAGGFPTDAFNGGNYWVDVVFSTTPPGEDSTPPTVASFTPASGATGVAYDANVTATFSEDMDATTINGGSAELRDTGNNLIAATVSYNAASRTLTLDPTNSLALGAVYTARIRGGGADPRVKDIAGNALAADASWSFTVTTTPPGQCPCSLFSSSSTPVVINDSDDNEIELGVKFQADVSGYVTALRFYKGPANTGVHIGGLWSNTGTPLATATFINESASGWQQVNLSIPVQIEANTTYVASYHTTVGRYSSNPGFFAASGLINGILRAPAAGAVGGNGVFKYGPRSFPNDTFNGGNYWVDVVFTTTPPAADTTPPTVISFTPPSGATDVDADANVTATFSEEMDASTINGSSVELRDAGNNLTPAAVSYNDLTRTVTLNPTNSLTVGTVYTARIRGGGADPRVKDIAGNALAADATWSFTPVANQPTGPGGPILVITSTANKFTRYYQEILLAEGFNGYKAIDISQVNAPTLDQYDVVILGEMSLSADQVTMLSAWVTSGGNLIAMRPDKQLASILGLTDASATRPDAYLQINTSQQPGAGIVGQTIQYHSTADLYTLAGATSVATIYSSVSQSTSNPAVTIRTVGSNGGQAAAFAFDLARSIVYTRQGNPAYAGQERDGLPPIRPNDLFYPDYVNLDKAAIPQADELQRLLGNMILYMNMDQGPLPRFWFLPNMKKAVILMTGDDHGTETGTKTTFDALIAQSPQGCSVGDWECLRATSWLYTSSEVTDAEANAYRNQGFEIGIHVNAGCSDWTPSSLDSAFTSERAAFAAKYTSLPAPRTNRTHCLVWSDWATHPKVELSHGVRLDETYYYWPGSWVQNRPGFMTGSGMPMRFADLDGSTIDVYQAATHLVNENEMSYPAGINSMLDKALGPEGYYGVFGTHFDHTDVFDMQLINSAVARNVSLISAEQLLTWLDGRNSSSFSQYSWDGDSLGFTINVGSGAANLFTMIPAQSLTGALSSITINGTPVTFTLETIKGRSYAVFRAQAGAVVAEYSSDVTPPTVQSVVPTNGATNVSLSGDLQITFSEAMDAATINAQTIQLLDSLSASVSGTVTYNEATRIATFNPAGNLALASQYTIRVLGGVGDPAVKDAAGNRLAAVFNSSFTTLNVTGPVSLWNDATVPALPTVDDGSSVEVGLKFRSDVAGQITAIRFYKGPLNTGTHTVSIWSETGDLLARANSISETASGWQTVVLPAPLNITANTTYVASYFTTSGFYSLTNDYFATGGFINGVLQALQDGVSGGNGVYGYGASPLFPTSSFRSGNYWVDIVFQP